MAPDSRRIRLRDFFRAAFPGRVKFTKDPNVSEAGLIGGWDDDDEPLVIVSLTRLVERSADVTDERFAYFIEALGGFIQHLLDVLSEPGTTDSDPAILEAQLRTALADPDLYQMLDVVFAD